MRGLKLCFSGEMINELRVAPGLAGSLNTHVARFKLFFLYCTVLLKEILHTCLKHLNSNFDYFLFFFWLCDIGKLLPLNIFE